MKRAKALLSIPLLFVAVLAIWVIATSAHDDDDLGPYQKIATITNPPLNGFDISWVDSAIGRYFLADRANAGIDVFDAERNTFLFTLDGFVGSKPDRTLGGPNGVVAIHHGAEGGDDDRGRVEVWAGDGVPKGGTSSVKVFDLASRSLIANIPNGGNHRADELAYDPVDQIILIANDADVPAPFVTFISAEGRPSDYHVLGKIVYDGTKGAPLSTGGIEQPVWDGARHKFYISIPSTAKNADGEVDEIDPRAMKVTRVFPITTVPLCGPAGLALLPGQRLITSCGAVLSAVTGNTVATVAGVGGDEIWFNRGDDRVYFGASPMPVVDAESLTVVATINDGGTHSVAADSENNHVFVPVNGVGVQVFTEEENGH